MRIINDNYFNYRQVPVDYDGLAKISSIRGNTLVFNQMIENGDFAENSGWTKSTNSTLSISNNKATVSATNDALCYLRYQPAFQVYANHKYLLSFYLTSPVATTKTTARLFRQGVINNYFENQALSANTRTRYMSVITATADCPNTLLYIYTNNDGVALTGNSIFENVMLTDLTTLNNSFITDASSFKERYSLPYYAFDSGSLLSFNGTGLKTTGKNLLPLVLADIKTLNTAGTWNDNVYSNDGVTHTINTNENGEITSIVSNGKATTNAGANLTLYSLVFKEGDYIMSGCPVGGSSSTYRLQIGGMGILDYGSGASFSATEGQTGLVAIRVYNNAELNNKVWYPMIRLANTDSSFVPFTTSTLSLPISTYFPTGMKSAGSVYDELTPNKAITRIGSRAYEAGDESDPSVVTDGTNTYYALVTPTEVDINIDLSYLFYKGGIEQILPENTSTPSTTPILCDITYYDTTEGDTPYRKFWMINANNERWNLTERELKTFLNNPQGLGFQKTITTNRYGNAQTLTDITDTFPTPNGEVLFYDSSNASRYEKYNEFVKFLSYDPITLYYQLPFSVFSQIPNIYTLECVVGTLTKTESKNDGLMTCPITFNALSFYKGDPVEINGSGLTYTLTNNADFPIGFEIELKGSMVNPYVTLEQDSELYGEAKFIDSVAFDEVYIDSVDGEQNVILSQNNSVLPNPLSYQDLSISNGSIYVTFVKLARGESTLTIGMDSGSLTSAKIKFTPIYRSV